MCRLWCAYYVKIGRVLTSVFMCILFIFCSLWGFVCFTNYGYYNDAAKGWSQNVLFIYLVLAQYNIILIVQIFSLYYIILYLRHTSFARQPRECVYLCKNFNGYIGIGDLFKIPWQYLRCSRWSIPKSVVNEKPTWLHYNI